MLSFLYRLVRAFRDEHGFLPNVVVMSSSHYSALQVSLPDIAKADLGGFLGMEIHLSDEAIHPHVAWMHRIERVAS